MDPVARLQPNPEIIWRVVDDGAVLVSPEESQVRVLNEVGTLVWECIAGHCTVGEIEQRIVSRFAVSQEQAGEDLRRFLQALQERGLITVAV